MHFGIILVNIYIYIYICLYSSYLLLSTYYLLLSLLQQGKMSSYSLIHMWRAVCVTFSCNFLTKSILWLRCKLWLFNYDAPKTLHCTVFNADFPIGVYVWRVWFTISTNIAQNPTDSYGNLRVSWCRVPLVCTSSVEHPKRCWGLLHIHSLLFLITLSVFAMSRCWRDE